VKYHSFFLELLITKTVFNG